MIGCLLQVCLNTWMDPAWLLLPVEPDHMLVLVLVEDPGQTPSKIPENSESCRTLMDDPVALSTNTDTYSPAWR